MKIHSVRLAALAAVPMLGACADNATVVAPGEKVKIQVAPLTLPLIDDVCYGLTVYNGDPASTPAPDTVWSQQGICATQYGNAGGGDIAYVGTCDANGQDNYVELILESVSAGGATLDDQYTADGGDADFENPCLANDPCYLHFACKENEDVAVTFNLTIMRDANQGFFDVAVNFEDIFCSAKFDSCYDVVTTSVAVAPIESQGNIYYPYTGVDKGDTIYLGQTKSGWGIYAYSPETGYVRKQAYEVRNGVAPKELAVNGSTYVQAVTTTSTGTPISLLFGVDGQRDETAVAAVACTAGPDSNGTEIVFSQPTVVCDDGGSPVTFEPPISGQLGGNHTVDDSNEDGYTLRYGLYFGEELLDCGAGSGSCKKVYYNIALDIADLAEQGLTNCRYSVGATAVESGSTTFDDFGFFTDPNGVYPGISFGGHKGIPFSNDAGPMCTANPLNGDGSLVQTGYLKGSAFGEAARFVGAYHADGSPAAAFGVPF